MTTSRTPQTAAVVGTRDGLGRASEREPVAPTPASQAPGPLEPRAWSSHAVLALQRSVGNRAVGRILARMTEREFAARNEGKVEDTQTFVGNQPQEQPEDLNEFVLWNYLVGDTAMRKGHRAGLENVAFRWSTEAVEDPGLRIRVLGYASTSGPADLNEELARGRAEAVRDFLVEAGIPEDRIVIDSSGSRLPLDQGTDGENLAHNRRVEVSKFVATTTRQDLQDLATDANVTVSVQKFEEFPGFDLDLSVTEDQKSVAVKFNGGTVSARVLVRSSDPSIEVGFIQFAVKDVRQAAYVDVDARGRVVDPNRPPTALLDYGHCLDAFAPCRDVLHAGDAFSDPSGSTAKPREQPTDILTRLGPKAEVPRTIDIPGRGRGALKALLWNLDYMIVLVARRGELVVPVGFTPVPMRSSIIFVPGGVETLRTVSENSEVSVGIPVIRPGAPPGLDIDEAMSRPTSRLREQMIRRGVAQPAITVADI
jgi:outer membrane protein OmpA-like peptidoglycan-associated protein